MNLSEFWAPIITHSTFLLILAYILGIVSAVVFMLKVWAPAIRRTLAKQGHDVQMAFQGGRNQELVDQIAYESAAQKRLHERIKNDGIVIQQLTEGRNNLATRIIELASELGGAERVEEEIRNERNQGTYPTASDLASGTHSLGLQPGPD